MPTSKHQTASIQKRRLLYCFWLSPPGGLPPQDERTLFISWCDQFSPLATSMNDVHQSVYSKYLNDSLRWGDRQLEVYISRLQLLTGMVTEVGSSVSGFPSRESRSALRCSNNTCTCCQLSNRNGCWELRTACTPINLDLWVWILDFSSCYFLFLPPGFQLDDFLFVVQQFS